jgi:hypothetical protein
MKKKSTLFLLVLALGSLALFSQTVPQEVLEHKSPPLVNVEMDPPTRELPAEMESYLWQEESWILEFIASFTYTSFDLVETKETHFTNPSEPSTLSTYTYNNDEVLTQRLDQERIDGNWVNKSRTRTEFNEQGMPYLMIDEDWLDDAWLIDNGVMNEYTFDGNNVATVTTSTYNKDNGLYEPKFKYIYTYDNQGRPDITINQNWMDGDWVNGFRFQTFYLGNNDIDYELMDMWMGTEWMPMSKTVWEYLANDGYVYTSLNWDMLTSTYNESMKTRMENDEHLYTTLMETSVFMNDVWSLVVGSQYENTYEGNALVQRITNVWSIAEPLVKTGGSYKPQIKEVFSEFGQSGIDNPANSTPDLSLYPNPVDDILTVEFSSSYPQQLTLVLSDVTGRVIMKQEIEQALRQVRVDLSRISPGLYFLSAQVEDNQPMIKRVVVK